MKYQMGQWQSLTELLKMIFSGKEDNWLQAIPGKELNILLRLYGPLEPWFDKTWRPENMELPR